MACLPNAVRTDLADGQSSGFLFAADLVPDADVQRLKEFGTEIRTRRYGENLAGHHHKSTSDVELAFDGDTDTFWSAPTGSHHSVVQAGFEKPITFDSVLIVEWLNGGQHVQRYAIEVSARQVDGFCPRFRHRAQAYPSHFAPVTAIRVRLNILYSSSEAHIREFQLFDSTGARSGNTALK